MREIPLLLLKILKNNICNCLIIQIMGKPNAVAYNCRYLLTGKNPTTYFQSYLQIQKENSAQKLYVITVATFFALTKQELF
jgi:hypothetical protein